MNNFLKRFLQGIILGFALITTIGGGTVAVLLGVYDDIINSISDLRKNPRESLRLIIPMALGGLVGIVIFIIPIRYLLKNFRFITLAFFVGLTIGGMRVLRESIRGEFKPLHLIYSLVGFLFVFSIGAFTWFAGFSVNLVSFDALQLLILFIVAFISMGGHVSPGISGTMLLLAFGYFEEVIKLFERFLLLQSTLFWNDFLAIIIFAIGSIVGLFAIAKIYKASFQKSRVKTNFTILGFIIGSLAIVFFNGEVKAEYAESIYASFNTLHFILSLTLLAVGFVSSYFIFGLMEKKTNKATLEIEEVEPEKTEE